MSHTFDRVRELVAAGDYLISRHGFRELANDGILAVDVLESIFVAVLVEDYPMSRKEPSVLLLHRDRAGRPVHVMWGVPKITGRPAMLVTAYRPDPKRWSSDFMKRSAK